MSESDAAVARAAARKQAMPLLFKKLRPHEISLADGTADARPGPFPDLDADRLQQLADSLRTVGQIQPVVVQKDGSGFRLFVGRRRLAAAKLIEQQTGQPFELHAIVFDDSVDTLQMACHENIKRRGLTPLQFAHLCQAVRHRYGWTGTKEVAEYLGVSRAQISTHDKLLVKPDDMDQAVYDRLLAEIASGRIKADSAFYALTHVRSAQELERAEQLAIDTQDVQTDEAIPDLTPEELETLKNATQPSGGSDTPSDQPTIEQGAGKAAKTPTLAKKTAAKKQAKKPAKQVIAKKHLEQAVSESKRKKSADADENVLFSIEKIKISANELNVFMRDLAADKYPPLLRNFAVALAHLMEGKVLKSAVLNYWQRISHLVKK